MLSSVLSSLGAQSWCASLSVRSLAAEAIKELGELDEYDESRVKPELLSWFDISREAFLRRLEEIKNIKAD